MSATDRELLELAARAAGLRVKFEEAHGCYWIELGQGIPIDVWNPLDHDGDALRLAVKLNLWVRYRDDKSTNVCWYDEQGIFAGHVTVKFTESGCDGDPYAAVRRAIVRAAAAIAAAQQTQGGE